MRGGEREREEEVEEGTTKERDREIVEGGEGHRDRNYVYRAQGRSRRVKRDGGSEGGTCEVRRKKNPRKKKGRTSANE